jgi:methyl-accepting chemotaxis protein
MVNWGTVTISRKISLSMFAIVMVVILLSIVAEYALSSTVSTFSALIDNESSMMQHGNTAKIALLQVRRSEKDSLYNDDASLIKTINSYADNVREEGKKISSLVANTNDPALIDTVAKFTKSAEDYQNLFQIASKAPVGQERMVAAIPMRKAAAEEEKQLDSIIEQLDHRILEVKNNTLQHTARMKSIVMAVGFVVVGLGIFFAILLTSSIVRPLHKLQDRMASLAKGSFDDDVPFLERGDEIGSMAKAVQVFKDNGIEAGRLSGISAKEQAAKEARQRNIDAYISVFQKEATVAMNQLASASTKMRATAESMSATAEETSKQSTAVAAAAEQSSASVSTVASAAEELSASVTEIARQTSESQKTADQAVGQARTTEEMVGGLEVATNKISEVMGLISNIASQTNLLALNATIEAARAGEAGKGFAVVASEVKNLAGQTAKATEEVGAQIDTIQSATKGVVDAIAKIGVTISQMNKMAADISSVVDQQNSAVREIAHNAQQASSGTQEVTTNITGVNRAASDTGVAATEVLTISGDLSKQAETLKAEIDAFLHKIQTA